VTSENPAKIPRTIQHNEPREPVSLRLLHRLPVDHPVHLSERVSMRLSERVSIHLSNSVSARVCVRYLTAVRVAVHVVAHGRSIGCTAVKATHHPQAAHPLDGS
jgi:hypothetical protein